jgi:hypothetical protein
VRQHLAVRETGGRRGRSLKALDGNESLILTVEVVGETARVHHFTV